MNKERQQLIFLIEEYKTQVKKAVELLNKRHKKDRGFGVLERSGYLDDNKCIYYEFHGIGCLVIFSNHKSVDFDYGLKGRCDGFQPNRLYNFSKKQKEKYSLIKNAQQIKRHLHELVSTGVLVKPEDSIRPDMFYLKEDWENTNPIQIWDGNPLTDGEIMDIIYKER